MSEIPPNLRYSGQHEWLRMENGDTGVVGITDYAQNALGDVTFVELPAADKDIRQGDEMAVIESIKAASDVYAPVSGRIIEVNSGVEEDPGLVNADPFGRGWLVKIRLSDPSETEKMMSAADYAQHVGEGA